MIILRRQDEGWDWTPRARALFSQDHWGWVLQKGNRIGDINNFTDVLTQQKCITTSADIAVLHDFSIKSLSN